MEFRQFFSKTLWPFLASAGAASVMILAFFIPSVQDQWDRYQARQVIEQYEALGDDFFKEKEYKMAEQAFAKAYELSEQKRLDIEVKRLNAKINIIYEDPEWGSKPPENLQEVDFQFLLHLQKGPGQEMERAHTLTSYGIYLASLGNIKDAEDKFKDAIRLNPGEFHAYLNLGNLYDEQGEILEAEKAYQTAIALDPKNVPAHYNLGLLFSDQGKLKEAEKELAVAVALDPTDSDAINVHNLILKQITK